MDGGVNTLQMDPDHPVMFERVHTSHSHMEQLKQIDFMTLNVTASLYSNHKNPLVPVECSLLVDVTLG